VPRVTYHRPRGGERRGLSEHEARERGIDVRIGLARTADSTRGYIHGPGAEYGVTKVIVDAGPRRAGRRSTMGPAAGEIVGIFVLAVRWQLPSPTSAT
jgi:pyruvate/2-oxoglutarate dehydrogenase complex dihydrolipoamide dehydrogenase (E3) component